MSAQHSMMVATDFRAYAGTTALRRGFNGKQPRTNAIALSDTIVTRADGTQYTIAKRTNNRTTTKRKSQPTGSTLTREQIIAIRLAHSK